MQSSLPNLDITIPPAFTPFPGDFLSLPIPEDDQLWGLSPISPMANWDKTDFSHSLEHDLKNAQVRNGQPTPPPYDDTRLDHESATKRRRPRLRRRRPPDRAKRAKFLERNRLAASKCRQKKKEHTLQLEVSFKEQSDKKENLVAEIARLRSEILGLKNEVLKHAQCGDEPIKLHLAQMVKKITDIDGPLEKAVDVDTTAAEQQAGVPVSAPQALSFGFDDPLQLEPAASAAAEAFEQQMRREAEVSLVPEGSYSFSTEDPTFDELINAP
ncbi:bZIP transcription factor bZIP-1 [Penicillium soppii]|uniref:bZIP transcription factor bZIP-1 n=1 Tax=Penicillium soppii TaxID=69789 RepID=UPI002547F357|nr:bZIP transcription factor bZIP-1 [Penicillium soppii]KAJ5872128.1 bZIP transcription factor bZIP-1 [Penicillium soppii]